MNRKMEIAGPMGDDFLGANDDNAAANDTGVVDGVFARYPRTKSPFAIDTVYMDDLEAPKPTGLPNQF